MSATGGISNEKERTQIGHYQIGKNIGEGTFGKVKLGIHNETKENVAIKILEKDKIVEQADVERVAREINILKVMRHPNIIQLFEIIETPKQLYLIMEYAHGGELFDYIVKNQKINEKESCKYIQQILSGVEYLHKLNIAHRDLKPENLLLDHQMNLKIVDFGLSNQYKEGQTLKTACGSPCYAAPEMVAGKRYDGLSVDIWSTGIIMFALLCGYLPFEDANTSILYKKIISGEFTIPRFVSNDARDLLKSILNTDPTKRFRINEIKQHKWYSLASQNLSEGIQVKKKLIPIEESILQKLKDYNFDLSVARKAIENNRHNDITATYYLLLNKFIQQGGIPFSNQEIPTQLNPESQSEKKKEEEMNMKLLEDQNKKLQEEFNRKILEEKEIESIKQQQFQQQQKEEEIRMQLKIKMEQEELQEKQRIKVLEQQQQEQDRINFEKKQKEEFEAQEKAMLAFIQQQKQEKEQEEENLRKQKEIEQEQQNIILQKEKLILQQQEDLLKQRQAQENAFSEFKNKHYQNFLTQQQQIESSLNHINSHSLSSNQEDILKMKELEIVNNLPSIPQESLEQQDQYLQEVNQLLEKQYNPTKEMRFHSPAQPTNIPLTRLSLEGQNIQFQQQQLISNQYGLQLSSQDDQQQQNKIHQILKGEQELQQKSSARSQISVSERMEKIGNSIIFPPYPVGINYAPEQNKSQLSKQSISVHSDSLNDSFQKSQTGQLSARLKLNSVHTSISNEITPIQSARRPFEDQNNSRMKQFFEPQKTFNEDHNESSVSKQRIEDLPLSHRSGLNQSYISSSNQEKSRNFEKSPAPKSSNSSITYSNGNKSNNYDLNQLVQKMTGENRNFNQQGNEDMHLVPQFDNSLEKVEFRNSFDQNKQAIPQNSRQTGEEIQKSNHINNNNNSINSSYSSVKKNNLTQPSWQNYKKIAKIAQHSSTISTPNISTGKPSINSFDSSTVAAAGMPIRKNEDNLFKQINAKQDNNVWQSINSSNVTSTPTSKYINNYFPITEKTKSSPSPSINQSRNIRANQTSQTNYFKASQKNSIEYSNNDMLKLGGSFSSSFQSNEQTYSSIHNNNSSRQFTGSNQKSRKDPLGSVSITQVGKQNNNNTSSIRTAENNEQSYRGQIFGITQNSTKAANNSVHSGVSQIGKHSSVSKINVHRGPFNLRSVINKDPKFIASEIIKAVESYKYYYKSLSKYEVRVEKDLLKFEIAVNMLQNVENVYLIKFKRIIGDTQKYHEICNNLLNKIQSASIHSTSQASVKQQGFR